jgi:hypothetical protein
MLKSVCGVGEGVGTFINYSDLVAPTQSWLSRQQAAALAETPARVPLCIFTRLPGKPV